MNLLLLTEAAGLQERLRRALVAQNHRLTAVAELPAALERLSDTGFDALIIDWSLTRESPATAVESIRRATRGERLFVLAMIEREQTSAIPSMYRNGVDDFVIKPCMLEELTARLQNPRGSRPTAELPIPSKEPRSYGRGQTPRSAGPRARTSVEMNEVKPPSARAPDSAALEIPLLQSVSSIAKSELQALSGINLQIVSWRMPARPAFAARISLTLAPQPIVLALSVAVEATPLRWLCGHLLEEDDVRRSSLDNMLCEIANTLAGAVKRAALHDGLRFQIGLPGVVPLHAVGMPDSTSNSTQVALTLKSEERRFSLSLVAAVARVRHASLPVARLREGTVLAEDLGGGALSSPIAAGTCLTTATIDRMTRALDPGCLVRIEERLDSPLHGD